LGERATHEVYAPLALRKALVLSDCSLPIDPWPSREHVSVDVTITGATVRAFPSEHVRTGADAVPQPSSEAWPCGANRLAVALHVPRVPHRHRHERRCAGASSGQTAQDAFTNAAIVPGCALWTDID